MSLFIGNISNQAKQDDLLDKFSPFGKCHIKWKGSYAFAEYDNEKDAEKAYNELQNTKIFDKVLNIEWSKNSSHYDRSARHRRSSSGSFLGKCYNCGHHGHLARNCPRRRSSRSRSRRKSWRRRRRSSDYSRHKRRRSRSFDSVSSSSSSESRDRRRRHRRSSRDSRSHSRGRSKSRSHGRDRRRSKSKTDSRRASVDSKKEPGKISMDEKKSEEKSKSQEKIEDKKE